MVQTGDSRSEWGAFESILRVRGCYAGVLFSGGRVGVHLSVYARGRV